MKFTKLLVIFLVLSMLLVSCNGTGSGSVTTEPDGTTVEPDTTTLEPDVSTIEPDATTEAPDSSDIPPETTLPPIDWTPPEPSDATEYIKYGEELIDISTFDRVGLYIIEPVWYYPALEVEKILEVYASHERSFIIQFTATSNAEATKVPDIGDLPKTKMTGTVDKIYYAGDKCDFNEGDEIDLISFYGLVKYYDDELILMGFTAFTVILRKGYSYIVAGIRSGENYVASPDTFELSSHDDYESFLNSMGVYEEDERYGAWVIGYRKHMFDAVLRNFPPVEPTRLED